MSGPKATDPGRAQEALADSRESRDPPAPRPSWRRDPLAWVIVVLGLAIAGLSVWWASRSGDAALSDHLTGVAAAPSGIVLTLLTIRLWRTNRLDARTRRAWLIITIALGGYGVGALIHFGAGTSSILGDIWPIGLGLEVATYPLVALGLALLPKPARTVYDWVLFMLDMFIVAWSTAMLIWVFFIYPAAAESGQDFVATFGAAFFPVWDLSLVFAIVAIVVRGVRESSRAALQIAGLALLLVFFGDMISDVQSLHGTYTPGGISGFFYSLAWFGMAVAAYAQWRVQDRRLPPMGLADYARSFPWLPYVAVAVAFVGPAVRDWNDAELLRQHTPATGLLIALVVVRLGVTARQNASLAAAERGRLAAAVDQAAEAVMTTDRTGSVNYVNPAFSLITGYSSAEILGRVPNFLFEAADPEQVAEMRAAIDGGKSWQGRFALRRQDGTTAELDLAASPLKDASGNFAGSVSVARDMTHERALESQLVQAQRMEAVGRLAGGVAHDFNNILTAISGFAELAAVELPADHPVSADIAQILRASDRAAGLTRALLAFSRRQVMQARLVDLNEVLSGLTPLLGRSIGEDVQLVVHLDPHLDPTMADRAQLEQVVLNLVVNARDAMPKGGVLSLATTNVDIDAATARAHVGATEGPYVALTVADTGVGMTPEVREHAFEPFFTTKARGKGTGMGLATVIGIVSQSGGFVDVESGPNVGSTFTVHLPRYVGAAQPDENAAQVKLALVGNEMILVAEDEDAVREFVERVLIGAGYDVRVAANGPDALTAAAGMPDLDLLFTDVVMPGMSGVELAAELVSSRPGLPVVYASGYSEEGVLRGAFGDASVPYLSKPFTAEALLTKVRDALDGRPAAEAQASVP
jgi:PAS domain S-box-containing protein